MFFHNTMEVMISNGKYVLHTMGYTSVGLGVCLKYKGFVYMDQGTTEGPGRTPPPASIHVPRGIVVTIQGWVERHQFIEASLEPPKCICHTAEVLKGMMVLLIVPQEH